jgi:TonB family protein
MYTRLSRLCAVILVFSLFASAQQTSDEYQVKAAYLYNFAKMVPPSPPGLPGSSDLIIGVFGGSEDFVRVLRRSLTGKTINGRTLEIRHLRSPKELNSCQLVFFRASERTTRAVIAQLGRTRVLLVGEDKEFLNDGGMINLLPSEEKITYEVNSAALERAGVHGDNSSAAPKPDVQTPDVQLESPRSIAFRVLPEFPRIAVSLKITGAVQLQAIVRADGTVKQVRVVGGHPVLAEAASQAVMQWRYEPGSNETTELVKVSFGH